MNKLLSKFKHLSILLVLLGCSTVMHAQFLSYSKSIGSPSGSDLPMKIVSDDNGNVYFLGFAGNACDLDPGPGTHIITGNEYVLVKLDSSGNFLWALTWENGLNTLTNDGSLTIDGEGNILLWGYYKIITPLDADPGPGTTYLPSSTCPGGSGSCTTGFIIKLDNTGNFVWAKAWNPYSSGPTMQRGIYFYDVCSDGSGNVYATGYFVDSVDFDPGSGVFNLYETSAFFGDEKEELFVLKLDVNGDFVWAHDIDRAMPGDMVVDSAGNIFLSGVITDTTDFDPSPGVVMIGAGPDYDPFLTKWTAAGNLVWANVYVNEGDHLFLNVGLDDFGNVYASGIVTDTVDFDSGTGTNVILPVEASDIFVNKTDNAGNFVWAKRYGSGWANFYLTMDVDGAGNVYTSNLYNGADLDPGLGVFVPVYPGNNFIQKLKPNGDFAWARAFPDGLGPLSYECSIDVDAFGSIYITGTFSGTRDFDPNAGVANIYGTDDAFILKLKQDEEETGIEDNIFMNEVNVYPNPANDIVTVATSRVPDKIMLSDICGKMISSVSPTGTRTLVDVGNLGNGVYILSIQNGSFLVCKKFSVSLH